MRLKAHPWYHQGVENSFEMHVNFPTTSFAKVRQTITEKRVQIVSDYHSSFFHFHLLYKQVTAHYALPTALAFLAISTRGLVPRRDVLAFGELTGGGALVTVRRIQIEELVCARDNGKTLVLVPRENFDRLSDESIINAAGYFHEVKVSPARLRIYAWISGL